MTKIISEPEPNNHHGHSERRLHGTLRRQSPLLKSASCISTTRTHKSKDERKKVLKLSVRKLKEVDDPEVFLRRSVLINNTLKRLQAEVRSEKMLKKRSFHSAQIFDEYNSIEEEEDEYEDDSEITTATSSSDNVDYAAASPSMSSSPSSSSSSEEEDEPMEDSTTELLLREVYMPPPMTPPPQMITGLDDDDIKVSRNANNSSSDDLWMNSANHFWMEDSSWDLASTNCSSGYSDSKHLSCGQSSLFGEIQNVAFNSLIASLET